MALNQRLELRQGQSLVMTPQLQQAIKLLQMSNIELQAFVDQELERNPLLERDERSEIRKEAPPDAPISQPDIVSALQLLLADHRPRRCPGRACRAESAASKSGSCP